MTCGSRIYINSSEDTWRTIRRTPEHLSARKKITISPPWTISILLISIRTLRRTVARVAWVLGSGLLRGRGGRVSLACGVDGGGISMWRMRGAPARRRRRRRRVSRLLMSRRAASLDSCCHSHPLIIHQANHKSYHNLPCSL